MVGVLIKFNSDNSRLGSHGYTIEDEAKIYEDCLQDVYDNPGWYLERLEFLREFRVSWVDYKTQKITKPYKFVLQTKKRGQIPKSL